MTVGLAIQTFLPLVAVAFAAIIVHGGTIISDLVTDGGLGKHVPDKLPLIAIPAQ
jgi:hypothetical protein